jgi:hypothetical protein
MEFQYYINLFKAILAKINKEGFNGYSACDISIAILQELSKDRRVEEMKTERENARKEPATVRQITYLKALGIRIEEGITKQEAYKVIKKYLRN